MTYICIEHVVIKYAWKKNIKRKNRLIFFSSLPKFLLSFACLIMKLG
jgi:hypothetical protein